MPFCKNKKKQFLKSLTTTITNELKQAEGENPLPNLSILQDIQISIIDVCRNYNILESNKILLALPVQKEKMHSLLKHNNQQFPVAGLLLITYLWNERNKKLTDNEKSAEHTSFWVLAGGSILCTSLGAPIPGLVLGVLALVHFLKFESILKSYKNYKLLHSFYSDLPDLYKNIIDLDLARRDIEIIPTDKIKDVLEKAVDYEKYQNKRNKGISKALSCHGVFATKHGPKQIILDFLTNEEKELELKPLAP